MTGVVFLEISSPIKYVAQPESMLTSLTRQLDQSSLKGLSSSLKRLIQVLTQQASAAGGLDIQIVAHRWDKGYYRCLTAREIHDIDIDSSGLLNCFESRSSAPEPRPCFITVIHDA